MMTAASVALGMNLNVDVSRPHARSTRLPVIMPLIGVLTPDALLTAVRVKLPVVGIDLTKLPNMLQSPSASISWLASRVFPLAVNLFALSLNRFQHEVRPLAPKFTHRTPWRWRCSPGWRWAVSRERCCQARQSAPWKCMYEYRSQYWMVVRRRAASLRLYCPLFGKTRCCRKTARKLRESQVSRLWHSWPGKSATWISRKGSLISCRATSVSFKMRYL